MTTRKNQIVRTCALSAGLCALLASWPGDAFAWGAARGPAGGAVAAGPRGAVAVGPRGGAAAVGPRGAVAVGPGGGAVATTRPAHPSYGAAVRPPYPAPVPVYPGYVRPVAPVATAAAVGVVAGATAGAVAAASAPPTTVVVAPTAFVIGATLAALPGGCSAVSIAGISYYQCGTAWVRPYMQGASVAYVVVPAP